MKVTKLWYFLTICFAILKCVHLETQKCLGQDEEVCAKPQLLDLLIVGGTRVRGNKYPFMVLVKTFANIQGVMVPQICGGTLIADNLVLTAAHCLFNRYAPTTKACPGAYVTVGILDRCLCDGKQQYVYTESVYIHPDFSMDRNENPSGANDIAILRLNASVDSSSCEPFSQPCVRKIDNLFLSEEVNEKTPLSVIGWGSTVITGDGHGSRYLLEADISTSGIEDCDYIKGYDRAKQICAKGDGPDSCVGDSGGPLMVMKDNKAAGLYGIVSGGNAWKSCGKGPAIYTSVKYYKKIIHDALDGNLEGFEPCSACDLKVNLILCILLEFYVII